MRSFLLLGAQLLRRGTPSIATATAAATGAAAALPPSYLLFGRHLSRTSAVSTTKGERTETIRFLEDSCHLPSKSAMAAAKRIQIQTIANAKSVLALLELCGFSKLQIASLVARQPRVLNADPDRTLKPKLDFFRGMRVSDSDVAEFVSAAPVVLFPSVGTIETSVGILRTLLSDDRMVIVAIRRYPGLIRIDLSDVLLPKITKLVDEGVPESTISALIRAAPKSLVSPKRSIDETLAIIREMDVDRSRLQFVYIFRVLAEFTQPSWEQKLEAYRGFGWSNDQIISAFTRHPYFMASSEEKIKKTVGFFAEKLGWGADKLCKIPAVMGLSLERRTKPRCLVLEILASKGLHKGGITMSHLFMQEKMFLEKFLIKYQDDVPELADAMMIAEA